jgi:hypothetical protein
MRMRPATDQLLAGFSALAGICDVRKIQQALGLTCCDYLSPCAKERRWITNFEPILIGHSELEAMARSVLNSFEFIYLGTDRSGRRLGKSILPKN